MCANIERVNQACEYGVMGDIGFNKIMTCGGVI